MLLQVLGEEVGLKSLFEDVDLTFRCSGDNHSMNLVLGNRKVFFLICSLFDFPNLHFSYCRYIRRVKS